MSSMNATGGLIILQELIQAEGIVRYSNESMGGHNSMFLLFFFRKGG